MKWRRLRKRPLTKAYPYVMFDALYEKVELNTFLVRSVVFCFSY